MKDWRLLLQFRDHRLANGLEIVAECNPNAHSTAFGFFVNAGSRDETDEISGVSHFLEHMTFKGTPTRTAADVNRELDEIGSHANAFTSEEQTVYYAVVLPEWQDRAIEILADILRPTLCEDEFEIEKQVILEEIAKYEDQPPFGAPEKCMAAHFQGHALARSVLGTTESVTALTTEQMRDYFQARYSPGNIAFVAAGNVDFDRLIGEAEHRCGHWTNVPVERNTPRAEPRSEFKVFEKPSAVQQYVVQIANGPAATDEDRFAGRLLATILGDDSGSRFYWELVDTGLAEYASVTAYEFLGTGIFMTFLCCVPDQAAENLQRLHATVRELESSGVTAAELTRAKSKVCSHVVLQSERSANRMFSVGNNWSQRREYRTVREVVDAYQGVTLDDIAAVLTKYPLSLQTTVAVGPLKKLAHPAT
jgi:predicted Zn-dependent peptidase